MYMYIVAVRNIKVGHWPFTVQVVYVSDQQSQWVTIVRLIIDHHCVNNFWKTIWIVNTYLIAFEVGGVEQGMCMFTKLMENKYIVAISFKIMEMNKIPVEHCYEQKVANTIR